jgi:hypothetical protein
MLLAAGWLQGMTGLIGICYAMLNKVRGSDRDWRTLSIGIYGCVGLGTIPATSFTVHIPLNLALTSFEHFQFRQMRQVWWIKKCKAHSCQTKDLPGK